MGKRLAAKKTAKSRKNSGSGAEFGVDTTLWAAIHHALLPRLPSSELRITDATGSQMNYPRIRPSLR